MDDPDIPEPAGASDLTLFTAASEGSDAARDELQQRYLHALRTVAAGYRGGDPDRDGLIDRIFDDLAHAPVPVAEGAVPITLFTLVRAEKLGDSEGGRPIGLVDLAGPSPLEAAGTATAGETARRRVLLDAFSDLDQRDQVLLWFAAVEGALPRSLSSRLSIGGADAASAKAFRARSNLRRAYAERRAIAAGRPPACEALTGDLVRWAEGDLPPNFDDGPRGAHLASCDHCQKVLAELHQITGDLLVEAAAVRRAMVGTPKTSAVPATTAVATAAAFGAPVPTRHGDETTDTLVDPDATNDPDEGEGRSRALAVLLVAVVLAAAVGGVAYWRARSDSHGTQVQAGDQQDSPLNKSLASSTLASVSIAPVHTATSTTSSSSTTTTTTTRRSGSHGTTSGSGNGGTSGSWTDPGTTGSTIAAVTPPTTVARTTAPPATTTPATTSATTATTSPSTTTASTDTP